MNRSVYFFCFWLMYSVVFTTMGCTKEKHIYDKIVLANQLAQLNDHFTYIGESDRFERLKKRKNTEKTYRIPIMRDMHKTVRPKLYLLGPNVKDPVLTFDWLDTISLDKESRVYDMNGNKQVPVFAVYHGNENDYKAVTNAPSEMKLINQRFYKKTLEITSKWGKEKSNIKMDWFKTMMMKKYPSPYGFVLDDMTKRYCFNHPTIHYFSVQKNSEKLYYFHADCTRIMKCESCPHRGKQFAAVFQQNHTGKINLLWEYHRPKPGKRIKNANDFGNRVMIRSDYFADLDDNGHPEAIINFYTHKNHQMLLVEFTGNNKYAIIKNIFNYTYRYREKAKIQTTVDDGNNLVYK